MASGQEGANGGRSAICQNGNSVQYALVLCHDVAYSAVRFFIQESGRFREVCGANIAQRGNAEHLCGQLA